MFSTTTQTLPSLCRNFRMSDRVKFLVPCRSVRPFCPFFAMISQCSEWYRICWPIPMPLGQKIGFLLNLISYNSVIEIFDKKCVGKMPTKLRRLLNKITERHRRHPPVNRGSTVPLATLMWSHSKVKLP